MVHMFKPLFFLVILQLALTSTVYGHFADNADNADHSSSSDTESSSSDNESIKLEDKIFNAVTRVLIPDQELCRDATGIRLALAPEMLWNMCKAKESPCTTEMKVKCLPDPDNGYSCTPLDHVNVIIVGSVADPEIPDLFIIHSETFKMIVQETDSVIKIEIDDPDNEPEEIIDSGDES